MPLELATAVLASVEQGFPATIDAIAVAARHAFLRRPWYAESAEEDARTLIATRPGGKAIGALPLVRRGPAILGIKAIAGPYWPFRFVPLAADANEAELTAALDTPVARGALGWIWRLGPAQERDEAVRTLTAAARNAGYHVLSRRAGTSYALDIGGDGWPQPSTLRNLRKHEKKLKRLGALDFRFITGAAWSAEVLEELAEIERNAWAGTRGDADPKFLDPAMRAGWGAAVADPVLAEMLSVGILSIGGAPAAFSFGLDCGRTRHCIATSYDERFADHSPGYLTGYWTYMKAAERGVKTLSLGAGDNGEKGSMGALPEGELADYLFVRGAMLAGLLRPFWR